MKNTTMKTMIAAAAFLAVAGVASAQTMEAKIPFAFRAGGKVLAPGTYRIGMQTGASGTPLIMISDRAQNQHALTMGFANGDVKKTWSANEAVLSFECGVSRCALREVWMGSGRPVYQLPVPSLGRDEAHHVAEIIMAPVKAD